MYYTFSAELTQRKNVRIKNQSITVILLHYIHYMYVIIIENLYFTVQW